MGSRVHLLSKRVSKNRSTSNRHISIPCTEMVAGTESGFKSELASWILQVWVLCLMHVWCGFYFIEPNVSLISFSKSNPPQNRQQNFLINSSKQ
jgi:hypothetical protein